MSDVKKTFSDLDDREATIIIASALTLHALVSSGDTRKPEKLIDESFEIGTAFVEECEKRFDK